MAVLVSPLKAEQDRFPFHSPTALVFVTDPSNQARVAPEDLARVYGLTGAEARLVRGLLDGMTLKEYGAAAGVRISTLRGQLKQVFAKPGASRQSDLLRRILDLEDHAVGVSRTGLNA